MGREISRRRGRGVCEVYVRFYYETSTLDNRNHDNLDVTQTTFQQCKKCDLPYLLSSCHTMTFHRSGVPIFMVNSVGLR